MKNGKIHTLSRCCLAIVALIFAALTGSLELLHKSQKTKNAKIHTLSICCLVIVVLMFAALTGSLPYVIGVWAVVGNIRDGIERDAEKDVIKFHLKIARSKQKFCELKRIICSLSARNSLLDCEKLSYMSQLSQLRSKKDKINEIITFLLDVQKNNRNSLATAYPFCFSDSTEEITPNFNSRFEKQVIASFEEAWATFKEKNGSENKNSLVTDFTHAQCKKSSQKLLFLLL